jgi:hypothetical protein
LKTAARNNIVMTALSEMSRIMPKSCPITSIRRLAAGVSVVTFAILGLGPDRADASFPRGDNQSELTSAAAAPGGGFWVHVDGTPGNDPSGTFAKDSAPVFENIPDRGSIAAIRGRNGYWVVSNSGKILARGDAPQLCDGQ